MPNGKQKLVMVPGTGVVAFPGDMEDEHVAAAIRAFRSQKAADEAAKSHPLNRQQPLSTEASEHARQLKAAQPLSSAIPHLPAWLNTPSTELGKQSGDWLSGEIGKALGTQLPAIDPSRLSESEAAQFRQNHPIAGGVAHGISDIANSLTTPASTALLLTAPESKLMSGLFSLQALHGAYKDAQAAREAYRQGSNEEATRYATESILGGAMGLAAGAHAVTPARGPQGEILPPEAKPQPELPSLPPSTPVTLEGKTGGFALPEYDEAPVASYQLIYKSPAANPEELNLAVNDLVKARESKGWSDPNAAPEETKAAQKDFYAAADRLAKLQQRSVGQIRQIPSGEKIVYLTQSGLNDLSAGLRGRAPDPEYSLNGVSIAGRYIPIVQANLQALNTPHSKELTKLLSMGAGPDGTVTVSAVPTKNETLSNALSRLREELNHGWQKQFSDAMGNHLLPSEFKNLNQAIPDAMNGYLRQNGYPEDSGNKEANRMRVLEASAKAMSGAPSEFGMTPDEAANYLFQYFDAVTKAHGPMALDELVHTTTLARNIKRDYANARYSSRGSQGQRTLPGLPAGGQGSPQAGAGAPRRGTAPVAGPPGQAGAATPSLAALRKEAALRQPSVIPGQTANLSYVSADERQPFYLKSDQIIDQKMKGPMNGPDVLRMLRNNGVKEDELETTGLADLLDEDRKFTPEEVKEFAAANPVQIEEVQLGGPQLKGWTQQDSERLDRLESRQGDLTDEEEEEFQNLIDREKAASEQEAFPRVTKYGQYAEPGGQNYRELLVTLPTLYLPGAKRLTLEEFAQQSEGKNINEVTPDTANRIRREYKEWREKQQAPQTFRGGHWDEPNVLVHIRANDRTLPDGRKVLHVEEIQSDWHQKGRKYGYANKRVPAEAKRYDGYWEVYDQDGKFITNVQDWQHPDVKTSEQALQVARQRLESEPERVRGTESVPNAPFKRTWHELALRRILKYAADHGYAGVSWTPGEKQAERYDLSKQVNEIGIIPNDDGSRFVRIEPKGSHSIKLMVNKEGTVAPAFSSDDQFAGKNIADVVGKDVADKIMAADKDTNLKGLDLKVGGEGMRGFYDKIVPDYLNKIGKKFGAKVGSVELGTKGPLSPVWQRLRTADVPDGFEQGYEWEFKDRHGLTDKIGIYEAENGWWVYKDGDELESELSSKSAAEHAAIEAVKAAGGVGEDATGGFPFLPITPAMRSEMAEPGPLFNQTRKPSIEASKAAIAGTAPFTLSQAEHWGRYHSAHDFKTEQEARDFMFRRLEHDDQQSWADIFGKNGPDKNRKIADTVPLHRIQGGKWKIGPKPKAEPISTERLGSGEDEEGNAPSVSWSAKDLQDTSASVTPESILRDYNQPKDRKAVVYQSYVPVSDLPEPKLAEEEGPEEDRATYSWEDFGFRSRSGGPPPVKLLVKPNGKVEIMDGNHRIKYWTEQGYGSIPAWVIDQRKGVKVDEPEMNQTRRTPESSPSTLSDLMEEAKRRAPGATRSEPFSPGVPTKDTTSEPGYIYHATNLERAEEIAGQGLRTHKPWEHTDQSSWPDGSTKKRSYFSPNAGIVWQFAPEEGKPVILRVKQDARFKREGTGDVYTNDKIPASDLEILDSSGKWVPIKQAFPSSAGITMNQTRNAPEAVTETPEFERWFGDSKVVDESGKPLVMYHGSPKTFTEFKDMPRAAGHIASLGEGHYFTSDRQTAENFMHGKKGPSKASKLYEVYIAAKSPFSVATADADRLVEAIKKVRAEDGKEPLPQRVLDSYARDVEEIKADSAQNVSLHNEFTGLDKLVSLFPKRVLQEAGYDAIAFHGNGKAKPFNEIVVFDPKQVKSATENHGTYDPTNPDITMNQTRKPANESEVLFYTRPGKTPWTVGDQNKYRSEVEKRFRANTPPKNGDMYRADWRDRVARSEMRNWASENLGKEAPETEEDFIVDQADWYRKMAQRVMREQDKEAYEIAKSRGEFKLSSIDKDRLAKLRERGTEGFELNQVQATKETARPKVQDLMAEALRRRPTQPTLSEVTKDIAARAPSVVP